MRVHDYAVGDTMEIVLDELKINTVIGIHAFELDQPQSLMITVTLTTRTPAVWNDDIASVLDYDYIRSGIVQLATRKYNLQETLCKLVLDLCMSKVEVQAATVYIRKTEVYADSKSVGVRLTASRQ